MKDDRLASSTPLPKPICPPPRDTPAELVEAAIARIERPNPTLNAVIIRSSRRRAPRRAPTDLPDGPFRGVPFLMKDMSATRPAIRRHGSSPAAGSNFIAPHDTHLAAKLRAAGSISSVAPTRRSSAPCRRPNPTPTARPAIRGTPTERPVARAAGRACGGRLRHGGGGACERWRRLDRIRGRSLRPRSGSQALTRRTRRSGRRRGLRRPRGRRCREPSVRDTAASSTRSLVRCPAT